MVDGFRWGWAGVSVPFHGGVPSSSAPTQRLRTVYVMVVVMQAFWLMLQGLVGGVCAPSYGSYGCLGFCVSWGSGGCVYELLDCSSTCTFHPVALILSTAPVGLPAMRHTALYRTRWPQVYDDASQAAAQHTHEKFRAAFGALLLRDRLQERHGLRER